MKNMVRLELQGAVHTGGVRPFFWKIAAEAGLTGWVANSDNGVALQIEGEDKQISSFIRSLPSTVPGAFRLRSICVVKRETDVPDKNCHPSFRIADLSRTVLEIRPDYAPCPDCIREALDPKGRRYCYPFSSCARCGPQYSFALRSPFARRNTSLTAFPMCAECAAEQKNGADAHHHGSEMLSCPRCGPQFFLLDMYGDLVSDVNPLCMGREAIRNGELLAFQSLYGGFQLFADAFNADTVQRLRRKRHLPDRPLCVMVRNVETVRKYCICSEQELQLLQSPAAPVVILRKRPDCTLPEIISPDTDTIAVGLPPSLPEKLLFEHCPDPSSPPFEVLVTCGDNRPGRAECLDIDEVFNRLMAFTDKFLCHDLKTGHACPPSICEVRNGRTIFHRRARGYVPQGIDLPFRLARNVGAFGCDRQAAVALGLQNRIIPSQALGRLDGQMETAVLLNMFERFTYLFDQVPDIMACDMDRNSFSAQACADFADLHGLPLVTVQTHHAHALACMAEHGLKHALALVLNGGSTGPDGIEWGSECLDVRLDGFSRLAAFRPGFFDRKRPARSFLDHLIANGAEPDDALLARVGVARAEFELWKRQHHASGVLTHSAMRLINAVCTAIGIAPDFCTYSDRCLLILRKYAMRSELADIPENIAGQFHFDFRGDDDFRLVDWSAAVLNLSRLSGLSEDEKSLYAGAFYNALAESMLTMALFAQSRTRLKEIVLSGSLFQDPLLREKTAAKLQSRSFKVFTHIYLPGDESCVPVGQAYAAGLSANN
ncbi:MAG: carbamoyltransferase HypF [Lentisphaeria bacterium]|nr:carbamoyltransferase HypF [Lentisphaeria bacterium]